jgi:hypothetical protein
MVFGGGFGFQKKKNQFSVDFFWAGLEEEEDDHAGGDSDHDRDSGRGGARNR